MAFSLGSGSFLEFLWKLFLTIAVSLPIGIEREKARKFAGLRTSLMIASFGFFSSFFAGVFGSPFVVLLGLFFAISIALIMYYARSRHERHPGLTTSTVFVLLFCLGVLVQLGFYLEAIASSIIITLLLSLKPFMKAIVAKLTEQEIIEALAFGFFSLVVLPLLPNRTIDPWGLFNPFVVWSMTLLVLALGFAGFAGGKMFGENGSVGVIGLAGGMVSVIALAFSLSPEAKRRIQSVGAVAIALSVAFSVMFLRILLLVFIGSKSVMNFLLFPLIAASAVSAFVAVKQSDSFSKKIAFAFDHHTSPFTFWTAFRFSVLFAGITVAFKILSSTLGSYGVYITAALAGFASMNALVVSSTALAAAGGISTKTAAVSILIGSISTCVAAFVIAYRSGGRKLALEAGKAFLASALICIAFTVGILLLG